jgi:hypothetical protein
MIKANALLSHLPTEPSDTRNQAHKENTAVALRTTGLSRPEDDRRRSMQS